MTRTREIRLRGLEMIADDPRAPKVWFQYVKKHIRRHRRKGLQRLQRLFMPTKTRLSHIDSPRDLSNSHSRIFLVGFI